MILETDLGIVGGVQRTHELYNQVFAQHETTPPDTLFGTYSLGGTAGGHRVRLKLIVPGNPITGTELRNMRLVETRSGIG